VVAGGSFAAITLIVTVRGFRDLASPDQLQRGSAHRDGSARKRFPVGHGLGSDVHHLHASAAIDV